MKHYISGRFVSVSNRILALCGGLALVGYSGLLSAQDNEAAVAENLEPVGQLCLQGQDCVGQAARRPPTAAAEPQQAQSADAAESSSQSSTPPIARPSGQGQAQTQPQPAAPVQAAPDNAVAQADVAGTADVDVEAVYQQYCFACHNAGVAGAPQPTDAAAWEERMQKGMDAVMVNVLNGLNAMPAKGLCMTCSEEDLRAVVEYMVEQSQ